LQRHIWRIHIARIDEAVPLEAHQNLRGGHVRILVDRVLAEQRTDPCDAVVGSHRAVARRLDVLLDRGVVAVSRQLVEEPTDAWRHNQEVGRSPARSPVNLSRHRADLGDQPTDALQLTRDAWGVGVRNRMPRTVDEITDNLTIHFQHHLVREGADQLGLGIHAMERTEIIDRFYRPASLELADLGLHGVKGDVQADARDLGTRGVTHQLPVHEVLDIDDCVVGEGAVGTSGTSRINRPCTCGHVEGPDGVGVRRVVDQVGSGTSRVQLGHDLGRGARSVSVQHAVVHTHVESALTSSRRRANWAPLGNARIGRRVRDRTRSRYTRVRADRVVVDELRAVVLGEVLVDVVTSVQLTVVVRVCRGVGDRGLG